MRVKKVSFEMKEGKKAAEGSTAAFLYKWCKSVL
jgi:hypothetical protein